MAVNLPKHMAASIELLATAGDIDNLIKYIHENCMEYILTPKYLGLIFITYSQPEDGYTREILLEELIQIHPSFKSSNGNQWARTNTSWLGKQYHIKRELKGGSVYSVKLDGYNRDSVDKYKGKSAAVINAHKDKPCVILDVHSSKGMEIDHKSGKYENLSNMSTETQKVEDFQSMSKAANDAKRSHCAECKKTGKRYDARRLGYSAAYIRGDAASKTCVGCYWYDPQYFNSVISKDFKFKF